MSPGMLDLIVEGSYRETIQACLAAAIKHSRLLADFLDIVVRRAMSSYDTQSLNYMQKKLAGLLEAIQRPGVIDGLGLGNNYPSFVFEFEPVFESLIEKSIGDLEGFLAEKRPDVQVSTMHLFDFARNYLVQQGKWDKRLQLEIQKGADFIFGNLPRTLSGSTIAEHFLETALCNAPGIIRIHGVGLAWPVLRGHEVLKNLPQRMQELD